MKMITSDPSTISSNHISFINKVSYRRVGDKGDFAILYIPGDNPRMSTMKYIPDEMPTFHNARLLYRDDQAQIKEGLCTNLARGQYTQEYKDIKYGKHDALYYDWELNTFKGLCGAILIGESKHPFYAGLHLAGKTDTKYGCALLFDKKAIVKTIEQYFNDNLHAMPLHSQGCPVLEIKEKNLRLKDKPNYKSPLNYLTQDDCVKYYGSHTGQVRQFRTAVVDTLICDSVAKIFKHKNIYAGPKLINSWKPWYAHAKLLSNLTSVDPNLLEKACIDLHTTTFQYLKNIDLPSKVYKISNDVNLAGLDGVPGFEPINLKASTGWPDCKPKSDVITISDRVVEGITCPRDAPEWVWQEVEKYENILSKGERVHLIHRCNLKDEPTKITKEKVRVFAGTPMVGLLLVRKYFLSICKLIMDHPIAFECGVGINPYSKKWTTLTKYMLKFGKDRVIAGDYKSYDSTMSSRMLIAGMKYLITIAEKAGYDKRDITIMQGLATELCFPTYEFNGDFIEVSGSNPSGHSLTVFLNNIVNSLYLRYSYYEIAGNLPVPLFKDVVSVVCYGDDNKMSVRRGYDWFNHTAIAKSLYKYGITYTMAEKDRESVPFITNEECNFLKRSAIWSDKYECYLAPLEMGTLFKILQSHTKSDHLSMAQQSCNAIQNVLREVFFHGKKQYLYFEDNLNKVLKENLEVKALFNNGVVPSYEFYEHWFITNYHPDKMHLISDSFFKQSRDDLKLVPQSYDMCDDAEFTALQQSVGEDFLLAGFQGCPPITNSIWSP
jgi:hypothetical protein